MRKSRTKKQSICERSAVRIVPVNVAVLSKSSEPWSV